MHHRGKLEKLINILIDKPPDQWSRKLQVKDGAIDKMFYVTIVNCHNIKMPVKDPIDKIYIGGEVVHVKPFRKELGELRDRIYTHRNKYFMSTCGSFFHTL